MSLGWAQRPLFEATLAQLSQCCMLALERRINKTGKAVSPKCNTTEPRQLHCSVRPLPQQSLTQGRTPSPFCVARALGHAVPPKQSIGIGRAVSLQRPWLPKVGRDANRGVVITVSTARWSLKHIWDIPRIPKNTYRVRGCGEGIMQMESYTSQ